MIILKKYFAAMAGLALIAILVVSCEKSFDEKTVQQNDFSNSAIAQVIVATVNATGNQVFVDNKQVSGTALITGNVFPATGYGFVSNPGLRAFLVTGAGTQSQLSFAENLQGGKHYSIFLYDTITTPKQKTVFDDIVIPSDTSARLRIANFIYNPTDVPGIDVFSFRRNAYVFTNVKMTDVTNFIPYESGVQDTLYIRENGSSVNLFKVATTLTQKRSYTLLYRGSYRGTRVMQLYLTR